MPAPKTQIEPKASKELLGVGKYPPLLGGVNYYPAWRWWPCPGTSGQAGGAGYFISQTGRLSSGRKNGADIPNFGFLILHPGLG